MKVRAAALQIGSVPGDPPATLAKALEWLDRAAARGAELAVFPEWYYPDPDLLARAKTAEGGEAKQLIAAFREIVEPIPGPATDAVAAKAREHGMYVAFATIERLADGGLANTSVLLAPSGDIAGLHRKTVLTPRYEVPELTPGDRLDVVSTPFGGIGQLICADASLPEAPRILAIKGAAIICHSMAFFYLDDRDNRRLGVDLMERSHCSPSRAIDNNVFIVTANLTGTFGGVEFFGRSRITNPQGEVIAMASEGVGADELLVADLDLSERDEGRLPFRLIDRRRPEIYADILTPNPLSGRVAWSGGAGTETEAEPPPATARGRHGVG